MAKLPDETLTIVFNLQRRMLKRIDEATATEAAIFEQFGEAEETIPELEQRQNVTLGNGQHLLILDSTRCCCGLLNFNQELRLLC